MAKIIKIPSVEVIDTKVVGVSKQNSDGSSRQMIIANYVNESDPVLLELEPDNPFDPDAIKVLITENRQIGYLKREIAPNIKSAIINEAEIHAKVSWVGGKEIKGVGLRIELVS